MTSPVVDKSVSVGEYDAATGLTHITHQRGRLLFNMGASVKKQQREDSNTTAKSTTSFSTGTFTGLSLYPEEAHYLQKRGALMIYLMDPKGKKTKALSTSDFSAMLAWDTRVSIACLDVYTFLKDRQLHPRRCLEPLEVLAGNENGRRIPRHIEENGFCDVAFDVWRTAHIDVPQTDQTTELLVTSTAKAKKHMQIKKLKLVFRVAVCRFGDAAPGPRCFRRLIQCCSARDRIPVKLAVVHHDHQSVLLFEISDLSDS
ncbi:hypothetical protein PsorP6_005126 [Peronosclerospora sorghi]|uniref:Uncharacterized protein n=1 Tax=Peronosclerospora sorghi TaxID=230839 RepID=A0ACC0W1X8_9STRA|nr:hypothetical protein PsorP6_005126 [Peronosclerospora sorghi]